MPRTAGQSERVQVTIFDRQMTALAIWRIWQRRARRTAGSNFSPEPLAEAARLHSTAAAGVASVEHQTS